MSFQIQKKISALRQTIELLDESANYRWTHQGACNCGHLVQVLTNLSSAEIHRFALEKRGEWSEHAMDYCPTSGLPIDEILSVIFDAGFSADDVRNMERLSDPNVLSLMTPTQRSELSFRNRDDVVFYFKKWIEFLESETGPKTDPSFADADSNQGFRIDNPLKKNYIQEKIKSKV
jgi:hypothetical protein